MICSDFTTSETIGEEWVFLRDFSLAPLFEQEVTGQIYSIFINASKPDHSITSIRGHCLQTDQNHFGIIINFFRKALEPEKAISSSSEATFKINGCLLTVPYTIIRF